LFMLKTNHKYSNSISSHFALIKMFRQCSWERELLKKLSAFKNLTDKARAVSIYLDSRQVLGESLVFFADLESELACVAHDDDRHLAVHRLKLLKRSQNEHGSLTHSGLSLAQDVHAEDSLWNALVLDCNKNSTF